MPRVLRLFYERSAVQVAPDLLGKLLLRRTPDALLSGRIVEVEAYMGDADSASHAFRGETPRNAVMFGPAGHVYVYRSYGMHDCMNVVTGERGIASAVLIRALEPVSGVEIMRANRGGRPFLELCNGPGKLCQALGITRALNGADLEADEIWLEDGNGVPRTVCSSTRVGISAALDLRWRFFLCDNPFVSRGKPVNPA